MSKKLQEPVSFYKCVEDFLKEERVISENIESLIQAREEAHYHMFNYSQDAQFQPYLPCYGENLVPTYGSSHPFMSMNPLVRQPEEQMSGNLLANPTFHLLHNQYDR
ncbi:Uncharacterized protein Fot_22487 [Forsythia ovata]|uniref:Uncharacterized protein n=1 Tax=Forsythia ovata TaxID=205694 RepID=A0ABD1UXV8_9LAMI